MTDQYLWKNGRQELGPFLLSDMRKMIRSGTLGRFQSISTDGGMTYAPAWTFNEIWESIEPVTLPTSSTSGGVPATIIMPTTGASSGGVPPTIIVPTTNASDPGAGPPLLVVEPQAHPSSGRGLGLAGFISGTAALVLSLAPFLIWATRYEAGYGAVPLSFLFLVTSITGLTLSAIAMRRRRSGFATTGLVVGICGGVLGLVTSLGWLVSHDPREDWIRRQTATAEADVQLARRNFTVTLRRYRDQSPEDDHTAARDRVTKDLMVLTKAHKRLLLAAASTPRFRKHFLKLEELRTAFASFSEAVKITDDISAQDAIDRIGDSATTLKELLDLLELHTSGQLSIEAAQAKFRDY